MDFQLDCRPSEGWRHRSERTKCTVQRTRTSLPSEAVESQRKRTKHLPAVSVKSAEIINGTSDGLILCLGSETLIKMQLALTGFHNKTQV